MKLQRFATYLVAGILLSVFSCERPSEVEETLAPQTQQSAAECGSHFRKIHVSSDSVHLSSAAVGDDAIYDVYVVLPSGIDSVWTIDNLELSFELPLPSSTDIEVSLKNSMVFDEDTDVVDFVVTDEGHSIDLEIIPSTCDINNGCGLWLQIVLHGRGLSRVSAPGGISIVVDDNL